MTHPLILKSIINIPDPTCYILKWDIYPIKVKELHLGDSFETYDGITDDGFPEIDSQLKVDTNIFYQKIETGIRIEIGRDLSLLYQDIDVWNEEFGLNIREYMKKEAELISEKGYLELVEFENSETSLRILYSFHIRETNSLLIKDIIQEAETLVFELENEVFKMLKSTV